jgi:hypothetical protein
MGSKDHLINRCNKEKKVVGIEWKKCVDWMAGKGDGMMMNMLAQCHRQSKEVDKEFIFGIATNP